MLRKFYLITQDDPRVEETFRNDAHQFLKRGSCLGISPSEKRYMQNRMTVDQLASYIGLQCYIPAEHLLSRGLEFASGPHGLSINASYEEDRLIGSMVAAAWAMPERLPERLVEGL